MVANKSLDVVKLVAALLHDVQNRHGLVFSTRALRLTQQKLYKRVHHEGLGFLTKSLPRLGKHLDKVLAGQCKFDCTKYGFNAIPGTKLPRFLGELFGLVLSVDGSVLHNPCKTAVSSLRDVLYLLYKYELPYTDEQEHAVISQFEKTEEDLALTSKTIDEIRQSCETSYSTRRKRTKTPTTREIAREAKILLSDLFSSFDPTDIHPKHGPGAVATKQKLWAKYLWTNVSSRITQVYPFDAYFCASIGSVCDQYPSFSLLGERDLPARVILVPKDSRGPRLISCEPVDFQWVQQGLGRAIVQHVEKHELTKFNVFFTDQRPNQIAALYGSQNGKYATLDLKEASDRVSVDLVRLLFPEHISVYLEACRSLSTVLPSGKTRLLNKFAPMGSCLCFPVMALTIWAILTAGAPDADTRESIHVYGDDVIVPTAHAANAIEQLESFGLKANYDKCCISGSFRESCGMDAFMGTCVTPVRIRTVWSSKPSPESYSSWVAYANSFWDRKYYRVFEFIFDHLSELYGPIPTNADTMSAPSLRDVPHHAKRCRRRWNKNLQKFEFLVLTTKSPSIHKVIDGWSMLLRYFSESSESSMLSPDGLHEGTVFESCDLNALSVSQYTSRRTSMLVRRWR